MVTPSLQFSHFKWTALVFNIFRVVHLSQSQNPEHFSAPLKKPRSLWQSPAVLPCLHLLATVNLPSVSMSAHYTSHLNGIICLFI